MKITHSVKIIGNREIIYLYIDIENRYEFAKENFGENAQEGFISKVKRYITNNVESTKSAVAVIVINGIIVGSLTMVALYGLKNENSSTKELEENVIIYTEPLPEEKTKEKIVKTDDELIEAVKQPVVSKIVSAPESPKKITGIKINSVAKTQNKATNVTTGVNKVTTPSPKVQTTKPSASTTTPTGPTVKLSNNGAVLNLDLEEYIIGVVAAEMPASFDSEALKAQAVAARTYAMKKTSRGITLVNSTSNQVYNTKEQMQAKWGASYTVYYNKIRDAVYATKGQVLKYNGEYIESLYYAISNGKSELPIYVWNTNYSYLQAVSSSWDANISQGRNTTIIQYSTLSTKLGIKVDKNAQIKALSRTTGDRVNEIKIGDKIFTGVQIRNILSLRSTDFSIIQNENSVTISTIGYGHGVGMSQYGANGAAKAGLTYAQILKHYYVGASIVNI